MKFIRRIMRLRPTYTRQASTPKRPPTAPPHVQVYGALDLIEARRHVDQRDDVGGVDGHLAGQDEQLAGGQDLGGCGGTWEGRGLVLSRVCWGVAF